MEFDKSRIYSAVNADELRAGDKVIVANTLVTLKRNVANNVKPLILLEVIDEDYDLRFEVNFNKGRYALAYLVERKENCGNCGDEECPDAGEDCKFLRCADWKPILIRAEKHYRPFKDTDELIKVWDKKFYLDFKPTHDPLTMPLIWVRNKSNKKPWLINEFGKRILDYLFTNCEFLDGSPCGVEE